jgi:hypothetical protein
MAGLHFKIVGRAGLQDTTTTRGLGGSLSENCATVIKGMQSVRHSKENNNNYYALDEIQVIYLKECLCMLTFDLFPK